MAVQSAIVVPAAGTAAAGSPVVTTAAGTTVALTLDNSRRKAKAANSSGVATGATGSLPPPTESSLTRCAALSEWPVDTVITGASTTAAARSFFPDPVLVLRAFGPAFADESADDVVFPEFPVPVSAAATAGRRAMTPPTPRASANAPTRPMC